jgi:hypothetical protein
MEHEFTRQIRKFFALHFYEKADDIFDKSYLIQYLFFDKSYLIQYLNQKTKSANRGSKTRGSFANLYAIYILVEDYINKEFLDGESNYSEYEGAVYTELFTRMRQLPFGKKRQNHALQYRSIPPLGLLFSQFSYDGILKLKPPNNRYR